jgi:hypothetical protein
MTDWTHQTLDASSNTGHYMALYADPVSLLPRAAYQSNTNGGLYYATCTEPAATNHCDQATGVWTTQQIEAGAGGVIACIGTGFWNSIAIPPSGLPGVAYQRNISCTQGEVRLITCANNCQDAARSVWNPAQVIQTFNGPQGFEGPASYPRLQYDAAGAAHFTYIDSGAQTLRFIIQVGSGNSTNFQRFDIDHQVDDGHSSFILTPLGSAHVSYALTTGIKYYPFGD